MLPMLMMRAGEAGVDAATSSGVSSCVSANTRCRLSVSTRVHAADGYAAYGAPQLDPLLLTRTSSSAGRGQLCVRQARRCRQDVKLTASAFLQLRDNGLQRLLLVEVGGDPVGFACAQRVELRARGCAGGRVARRYVHVGAVGDEAFADHAADAFGAAGYEDDFALRMGLVV
jgi:hypothetical protein